VRRKKSTGAGVRRPAVRKNKGLKGKDPAFAPEGFCRAGMDKEQESESRIQHKVFA
jgi:hypothetical protein